MSVRVLRGTSREVSLRPDGVGQGAREERTEGRDQERRARQASSQCRSAGSRSSASPAGGSESWRSAGVERRVRVRASTSERGKEGAHLALDEEADAVAVLGVADGELLEALREEDRVRHCVCQDVSARPISRGSERERAKGGSRTHCARPSAQAPRCGCGPTRRRARTPRGLAGRGCGRDRVRFAGRMVYSEPRRASTASTAPRQREREGSMLTWSPRGRPGPPASRRRPRPRSPAGCRRAS